MNVEDAIRYVGGGTEAEWRDIIQFQMRILREVGLTRYSSVLEIGAGALGLAHALVPVLDKRGYVGIEPNLDVVQTAPPLDEEKDPLLLFREDFDPTESGRTFDIVFAHSVVTHMAAGQLPLFLRNVKPHLRPGAVILVSVRLGEDTNAEHWVYPGAVYFSMETLQRHAATEGLEVNAMPEFRSIGEASSRRLFHDWVLFS